MREELHTKVIRIGLGIIFLVPGIFKLISPDAFLEYLTTSPVQIPGGELLFYPVTILEIIGGIVLIFNTHLLQRIRPLFYLMFIGILLVATASVVIPDAGNMFADQQEMAKLYQQAHPSLKGLNMDIFPSKIGLINILFHLFGVALLASLLYKALKK
ncbi:DoxX family protein [Prolixibacteraceae bacterium JC049]|nr:DoxX family protein [Prolixibacteraceae bacterium JC049]